MKLRTGSWGQVTRGQKPSYNVAQGGGEVYFTSLALGRVGLPHFCQS